MTSAGTAASPLETDLVSRAWRDRLLGLSAFRFAGSAVLFAVSLLLQLLDAVQNDAPSEFSWGKGVQMLSPVVAIPALVLAGLAFLFAQARRAPRLRTASAVLAAAFATGVVGDVLVAHVSATHDLPTKVIAATSADAQETLGSPLPR